MIRLQNEIMNAPAVLISPHCELRRDEKVLKVLFLLKLKNNNEIARHLSEKIVVKYFDLFIVTFIYFSTQLNMFCLYSCQYNI